jgi:hypothetical protein
MQPVTPTLADLVPSPFTLYFLGCAIYMACIINGRQAGALPKFRWASALLVACGCFVAWGPAWLALNPDTGDLYRQMLTRKLTVIQIGTPFIGVFLIAVMIVVDVLSKRYIRQHYMA